MDGGRRKDGEWHKSSSSGGRSPWTRNAEVRGSNPLPGVNINSLTGSVDGGPRANYFPSAVPSIIHGSSSTFPRGISSAPDLPGSSHRKGGSADADSEIDNAKASRRNGKGPPPEVFPGHMKPRARQDPGSNRRSAANGLDLRKTVNIGARDGCGWQELMSKSGAEESLLNLKKQMAELALSSRKGIIPKPRDSAEFVAESVGARIKASDMPSMMQIHAFRCARRVFDGLPIFSSKQLAFALKKEFDNSYGVAWHCIVGTSFGSFVTHSAGGFLYFCIDRIAILLFKTTVERLESL